MNLKKMNVCIVIPVHNEGKQIGRLIRGIREKGFEPVVIDDGSTDNSGKIAEENGAVVIVNKYKQGKGSSLQRGFHYARGQGYLGVIAMDGDGQHAVGDLDTFLDVLRQDEKVGLVCGSRMNNSRGMPLIRYLTNRVMSSAISGLCKQHIPDSQCGFRYLSCDLLDQMTLSSSDFEIETEVLVQASRLGFKILSVPIQTIYRNEKSKINPLTDTFRFFLYLIREMRHSKKT